LILDTIMITENNCAP